MAEKPSQLAPELVPQLVPSASQSVEKTAFDAHSADQAQAVSELRVARRAGMRWRGIARYLGLGIFVFGAALLFYVFLQALEGLQRFANPGRLNQDFNSVAGDTLPSVIQAVVSVFGTELLRVLYLFILGFIASAIAARGIQFFAASEAVIDEAVLPDA
ncbi:hypothetical protein B1R32_11352 [Abditibacterium utsteinense]|uniref:DUF3566 domain-containing protein n=1 Tax=Abditibacterium utsteinense TaxID=1960156 RepID=A0A2S8SRB3_9BACT|nr:hypothetical protein [Abditibacterium utsteinense]PQV63325.1 hypothetical protein B1R32_11352 [Abditibacterium utsteinense]